MKIKSTTLISILILMMGLTSASSPALAQTTEELIASLHSPVVKTRREAAKKLGERRDRAAVQPLIEVLKHDEATKVRQAAARSLGFIKLDDAIPALLAALKDPAAEVRQAAVVALVAYYIEHDIGFITARRKGLQRFNPFLDTYESTIIEPYTEVDPRIIDGLAGVALRDHDRHVKKVAIRSLGVLRATRAIDRLGDLMFSNSFLRVEILRTFIKLGDRSAIAYIIPFLNDDDSDTRYEALTAAGALRSDAAVKELIKVYNSNRGSKTKRLALRALALIGDPAAEDVFLANLTSGESARRRFAYEGLARMGDEQYVERVSRDRLREHDDVVKLAQAFALYKLGRREYVEAIIQDLETGRRRQAYDYLLELRPEDLYPYLRQVTLRGRKWIVQALGHTGTQDAIGRLEPLLKSSDPEVVSAATLAIERIKRRKEMSEKLGEQTRPKRIKNER